MTPISALTARTLIHQCCIDEVGDRELAAVATSRALDLGRFALGDAELIQVKHTWFIDNPDTLVVQALGA